MSCKQFKFLAILNEFSKGLSLFKVILLLIDNINITFFLKIFHVSNLNVRDLDLSTHLHQFDANCGKIQYVSDPLTRDPYCTI